LIIIVIFVGWLYGQIGWLRSLEDAIDILRRA